MFHQGVVWTFNTERFCVSLEIYLIEDYRYDGDDEDGQIQRDINSGNLVAFDTRVCVELGDALIGSDSLGASVYSAHDADEFWTAHRDPNPLNRNCSIMRSVMGHNRVICHYFPDMVRNAIKEARTYLRDIPKMRNAA